MGHILVSGVKIILPGRLRGAAPVSVNLGPLISQKLFRARKLKFYIRLRRVTYLFQV